MMINEFIKKFKNQYASLYDGNLIVKFGNIVDQENIAGVGVEIKDYVGDINLVSRVFQMNKGHVGVIGYLTISKVKLLTQKQFNKKLQNTIEINANIAKKLEGNDVFQLSPGFHHKKSRKIKLRKLVVDLLKNE